MSRAVSLILCHDKMKARARQIEKFAEVAIRLRALNNYSGLRAIITAINQATFPGDPSMEIFKSKTELHKKYLSSDILLRTTGSHQSYRMALRNTKGPCIPSMLVLRFNYQWNRADFASTGRFIPLTCAERTRVTLTLMAKTLPKSTGRSTA